ncbi:tape measure protein [Porphyromonas sp. oral taxon 278]|uniref:tape measure protein n=1 Tax=Porphyromonas sp. oral taxon 278 TaxID=712437 RepID=UPI0025EFE2AF|nr:tape measure protein [Porphyromonas sp. oral taxon 278]
MAQKKFAVKLETSEFIRSAKGMEEAMDRLTQKMNTSFRPPSIDRYVSSARREVDLLGESFRRAGALAAGIFAVDGIQAYISRVISIRGEFQQTEIALNTMLGSQEKAHDLMAQLTRTAAETPFDLQGITSSAKQLLAYGFAAEQVNDTITRLGNIASGLSQPLGDIVYLYGTLKASGRVTAMDLRQFAGRGIPIYEELARVVGKNAEEITKMVSAGKIGFPDIEKAFNNLTNEGGKFYNLMQEQSKSLTGQISNLQDNIDVMFNEIGKASQGFISEGIRGVAFLVENYKTVGKVIGSLISIYGVYRASVITNIALTRSWAVAARTDAIAKGIQTVATNATTLATKRLTAALLANPYGAIAVALTTVVSMMWAFSDSMSVAEKAQKDFNEEKKRAEEQEQKHREAVEALLNVVRDEASATADRQSALEQLQKYYPQIFDKYDTEALKLQDIAKLKREIAEYDGKAKVDKAKSELEKAQEDVEKAKKMLRDTREFGGANAGFGYTYAVSDATKRLDYAKKQLELKRKEYGKLSDGQLFNDKGLSELTDKQLSAILSNVQKAKRAVKQGAENRLEGSIIKGVYDEKGWENLANQIKREQEARKKPIKSYKDAVTDLKKEEDKANRELKAFNALTAQQLKRKKEEAVKSGNYNWDPDEERKRLKEEYDLKKKAREEYEKGAGETSKKSGKSDTESPAHKRAVQEEELRQRELRLAREEAKTRRDTELQLEAERIELMREGYDKEMAELTLQHKRKMSALDDQVQERLAKVREQHKLEWEATHNSKKEVYRAPDFKESDLGDTDLFQILTGRELADQAYEEGQRKLFRSLQEKYASYEERKTEVAKKYQLERDAIAQSAYVSEVQRSSLLLELARKEKDELKSIDEERYSQAQKTNELMVQLFLQQGDRTASQMRDTISKTRELLDYLASTKSSDLSSRFGMSGEDLRAIQGSPERIKAITDALKNLQGELASVSPWQSFATNLEDALDKGKRALADYKRARQEAEGSTSVEDRARAEGKAKEAMSIIGLSISKVGKSVKDATPLVKELGQSLGNILGDDDLANSIATLTDAMSDLSSVAVGVGQIMSGDVLGGVTSIVSTIGTIIANSRKIEKEAEDARKKSMQDLIRAQNDYNAALLRQNLLYERGMTFFGEDSFGRAKNAIAVARQAMESFRKSVAFSKKELSGDALLDFLGIPKGRAFTEKVRSKMRASFASRMQGDFDKLLNVQVKTGSHTTGALWWKERHDDFSTIGKLYPELIDKSGKLNLALAESILKNREFASGHKEVLENAIELYKQVEESAKVVSDYMRGLFGQLGSSITDALVSALRRGEDATQAFTKSVSEMLNNFIKQMAYSAVLAPIFERAQKDVTEAMNKVGLSDEDRFSRIAEVMQKTVEDAKHAEPLFRKVVESYDDIARKNGFDTKGTSLDSRSATAKGIAQASQDSIDTLTGLWHTNVLLSERTANATEQAVSILTSMSERKGGIPSASDLGFDQFGVIQRKSLEELTLIRQNTEASAQATEAIRFVVQQMDSNGIKLRK